MDALCVAFLRALCELCVIRKTELVHSKAHYLFICENEVQQGPFPPTRMQRMLRDGEITEAAFVWREGLTEWQPINSVLPRLASIRQKEYLKFLGEPIPRGVTFEEAQQRLDALVAHNPARNWHWIAGTFSRKSVMKSRATSSGQK